MSYISYLTSKSAFGGRKCTKLQNHSAKIKHFLLHDDKSSPSVNKGAQGVIFDVDFICDHQINFWWSKMHEIAESFCKNKTLLLHDDKSSSSVNEGAQGVIFDVDFIFEHQINFWWSKMHDIAESFCKNKTFLVT